MLRKADLVKQLSNGFGLSKNDADRYVSFLVRAIKDELKAGRDVMIPGLFTLYVKDSIGRDVIVPKTGIKKEAKIYKRLCCRFSKNFRNEVKKV